MSAAEQSAYLPLLARSADQIFWLARYMERAENMARILDVNNQFSADARGSQNWRSVVQIFADEERFHEAYDVASYANVVRFYVTDRENAASIVSSIRAAKENARGQRPLISTEMWVHLNVFNDAIQAIRAEDMTMQELPRLCSWVKEQCQMQYGITEGTFFRGQSWLFYQLGKHLERADQTTRILDIKYHLLLPTVWAVGGAVDVSQWNALLRSVAGYHAFRRVHPRGMSPEKVAGFLLLNGQFARSVVASLRRAEECLDMLRREHGLRAGAEAAEMFDEMNAAMGSVSIENIISGGLHEFIDSLQRQIIALTIAVRRDFCGVIPDAQTD